MRAIWKVILFVWNRRSSTEFRLAGKEKRGMFFREAKFTVGMWVIVSEGVIKVFFAHF